MWPFASNSRRRRREGRGIGQFPVDRDDHQPTAPYISNINNVGDFWHCSNASAASSQNLTLSLTLGLRHSWQNPFYRNDEYQHQPPAEEPYLVRPLRIEINMGSQEQVQGTGDFEDCNRPDVLPDVETEIALEELLSSDECTSAADTVDLFLDALAEGSKENVETPDSSSLNPESSKDQKPVSEVAEEVQVDAEAAKIAEPTHPNPSSDASEKSEKTKMIAGTYVQVDEDELEKKKDDKKKDSKTSPAVLPKFENKPLDERQWLWIGVFVILSNLAMAIIDFLAYIPEINERTTTRADQMIEGPLFRREPYQCFQYFESDWGKVVRHQGHSEYRFLVGYFLIELGAIVVLMINCYVWWRQRSSEPEKWKLPPKHATMFQNYSLTCQSCLLLYLISYVLCPLNFSLIIWPSNLRLAIFGVSLVTRFATWVFVIKDCDTNKNYIWVLKKRTVGKTAFEIDVEKSDKASEACQAGDGDSTKGLEQCKKRRIFPTIKELFFDTVEDTHRWELTSKPTKQDPEKKAN